MHTQACTSTSACNHLRADVAARAWHPGILSDLYRYLHSPESLNSRLDLRAPLVSPTKGRLSRSSAYPGRCNSRTIHDRIKAPYPPQIRRDVGRRDATRRTEAFAKCVSRTKTHINSRATRPPGESGRFDIESYRAVP